MRNSILITGATGLLGQELLRQYAKVCNGTPPIILIRAVNTQGAQNRYDHLLKKNSLNSTILSKAKIICADIACDNLGLTDLDYSTLASQVNSIFHLAANTNMHSSRESYMKHNLIGTKNIAKLVLNSSALGNKLIVNYFSTAFVCGGLEGVVNSKDMPGNYFRNDYEESKALAEKVINALPNEINVKIFRPSIVADKINLRLPSIELPLSLFFSGKLKAMLGDPECPLDIVTAEYVIKAVMHLHQDLTTNRKIYHLTAGDNKISLGEILRIVNKVCRHKKTSWRKELQLSTAQGLRINNGRSPLRHYVPYLSKNPHFCNKETLALLPSNLVQESFSSYAESIIEKYFYMFTSSKGAFPNSVFL